MRRRTLERTLDEAFARGEARWREWLAAHDAQMTRYWNDVMRSVEDGRAERAEEARVEREALLSILDEMRSGGPPPRAA